MYISKVYKQLLHIDSLTYSDSHAMDDIFYSAIHHKIILKIKHCRHSSPII